MRSLDLPLTRLPVHNPPDCFHSVSILHATSLISYATWLGRTFIEFSIELLFHTYTYSSVTPTDCHCYGKATADGLDARATANDYQRGAQSPRWGREDPPAARSRGELTRQGVREPHYRSYGVTGARLRIVGVYFQQYMHYVRKTATDFF